MKTSVSTLSSSTSSVSSTVSGLTSQVNRIDTLVGSVNSTVLSPENSTLFKLITDMDTFLNLFFESKSIGLWHMNGQYSYKQVEITFFLSTF